MIYRIGRKQRIAKKILVRFPEHEIYIEPFFGAGGMFFNKPKVKYNFINDYSDDVFNLFMIIKNRRDEFVKAFLALPIDQSLFRYWTKNQEKDPIYKALRFVLISNFSYLGQGNTFALLLRDVKNLSLSKIPKVNELLQNVNISCMDFEKFLKSIIFDNEILKAKSFIYADPPYVNTSNNYGLKWSADDTERLFIVLRQLNIKFAISETESELIYSLAERFNLNVIEIAEVKSLATVRKELLITNY